MHSAPKPSPASADQAREATPTPAEPAPAGPTAAILAPAASPAISYPAELPVSQHRDEIAAMIRDHQVVIIAGETGSGKTTQLPKICLELGRTAIGHTQPRRIAARAVAERIAEELASPLGTVVGYQVRFTGKLSSQTVIKLMTDGILLAELQHDRRLRRYDTLIIDEAHERSLNVDFILGYLKQLLPQRPDLKVIITSATIDPVRFSRHFDDAPVIEVSGRVYPVEIRYRPPEALDASSDRADRGDTNQADAADVVRDQVQSVCEAVDELAAIGPGDILVFLSGEREIRDTAEALVRQQRPHTEVLPLYGRLSAAEQHRVFTGHTGRRIVLATNVAETSLTVPGIRFVVDPGTARISRFSQRLKVQRLPIEPISQASANQRAGRCGRTADGVCVRLYSEADFAARPPFTEPEILRTNLASVLLQMAAIGLGDVAAFPFVEPPDRRSVNDGVALLVELGALAGTDGLRADALRASGEASDRALTQVGRRLARIPLDPRLGRMVLAANDLGCLTELLVIAAALSIQDPRERPLDRQEQARTLHARFRDPESDFMTYLNLWNYLQEQQAALSTNQFRRLCKNELLNYLRVREWQDLHAQLRQVTRSLGLIANTVPAASPRIHQALLAGLLSHLGLLDVAKPEYLGARGARFVLAPDSALHRKGARWVMAAELVETNRLYGRVVAKIEPQWAEQAGEHLVKKTYSEPHWSSAQGSAMALEKVTLYGVPLVAGRKVYFGRINPGLARELFIRHALVEGDWSTRHDFTHRNKALIAQLEEREHRWRRRAVLAPDETIFDFYDQRLPASVTSARHFDTWWKSKRRTEPDLLNLTEAILIPGARATGLAEEEFPDWWPAGEHRLPVSYRFEPGANDDGVSITLPLELLEQLSPTGFDWHIPGLRLELVTALIRSLPKALRRSYVPAADYAADFLANTGPADGPLLPTLAGYLRGLGGAAIAASDFDPTRLDPYLRITFKVHDGQKYAEGKDLGELRRRLAPAAAAQPDELERHGLTSWTPGNLAKVVQRRRAGHQLSTYPALVDEVDSVAIKAFASAAEQAHQMRSGTRRLLLLELPSPIPLLSRRLPTSVKLGLTRYPYAKVPDLLEDCVGASVDALVDKFGGPAWADEDYYRLRDAVGGELVSATVETVTAVERIVASAHEVRLVLAKLTSPALAPSVEDARAHLFSLIRPGFVAATGWARLDDLPRYLRGLARRCERLPNNPRRDLDQLRQFQAVAAEYQQLRADAPAWLAASAEVEGLHWMLQELRISLFAQELRTPYPISDVRIFREIDRIVEQFRANL